MWRVASARDGGRARAGASANRGESQGQLDGQFSWIRFESIGRKSGSHLRRRDKKVGPPLGNREPRKARSVAGVVFTPARGVIHPSFPLRGRWERSAKSDKQAPSPSLVSLHISSFETRPQKPVKHGCRQCKDRPRIK